MSNLNMPVKYCKDENDEEFSPVVYQESMFNDDGTRMDPVPRKMFAKAYDPTKTYPTENLFCIQDNKYYKFTGSGTTTGAFDDTKWTETDDATELTALNSTFAVVTGTLNADGKDTTINYPSGFTFQNTIVMSIMVEDNAGNWRCGIGTDSATIYRLFVVVQGPSMSIVNKSTNWQGHNFRLCIKKM